MSLAFHKKVFFLISIATLVREGFCVDDLEDKDMRRVVGLSLAVILLLLAPAFVSAQSLLGIGLPWAPSLGGALSGPASCCDPGGLKCCPVLYLGYEINQSRGRNPLSLGQDFAGSINSSEDVTRQRNIAFSDPGGLWLGISNYCQCSDRVGIMASGWYLFPSSGDAEETYTVSVGSLRGDFKIWNSTRSWGWIDGALVLGDPCGLNLIAGFRWDSYSVRLTDPRLFTGRGILLLSSSGEADLTLNSYIPLIGTQSCCGGPCCGLLVRVVGFPWVPGNLRFGETGILGRRLQANGNYDRARFLEVFSEYSRTCPGFGCLGIFARWNYLDVKSATNAEFPGTISLVDSVTPIRTSWTIGGRIALDFNLPF